jgi:hypothetical protein
MLGSCPACTTTNGVDANFCKKCGARLTANAGAPFEPVARAKPPDQSLTGATTVRLVAVRSDSIDDEA